MVQFVFVKLWRYSLLTLVIPSERQLFKSYADQKNILSIAEEEGVFMKIDVTVHIPLEFTLTDPECTNALVDKRSCFHLQFISPHFCPSDPLFTLDSKGHWRLAWQWRISDMDHLVLSHAKDKEILMNPKSPQIDWFGSRKSSVNYVPLSKNNVNQIK